MLRNAERVFAFFGPISFSPLKPLLALWLAATFIFLLPVFVSAQAVSGVTGVVTDSAGAVVPGVDVTLTDTKTSKELTTKTNEQGVYLFSNVLPGDGFKLTFAVTGFQTLAIADVTLGVGKTETQNAQLVAGAVSETVEVTASNDITLNTTDASIGNIIDRRQLRELPIQIRNSPAALIGLQPGVIGNNVGTGATNRVGSVTGARTDQGNITIDGIDANDQATGQAFATVANAPIDAIQEFRAVSANPHASEGRSSGGQIQLVTRSGSNDFHGSLREYHRNDATAANTFFNNRAGIERRILKRNQFGGSLGGRIIRDKLFFFFDYEGRRDKESIPSTRIVPLNHFRNGTLGYINNGPGCTAGSRINTQPGCISFMTPAQVAAEDPLAIGPNAALLNFITGRYPGANDLSLGDGVNTGGFRFNAPASRSDDTYTTRLDWNISDKQTLFGRFNIANRNQDDIINSVSAQFPNDPETAILEQRDYAWAVGHNWVLSDSFVNKALVGVSHSGLDFRSPFAPALPNSFSFSTLTAPFAAIDTQNRIVDTPTIRDDAQWTIGNHSLAFGIQIKPIRSHSGIMNDLNFPALGLGGNLLGLDETFRPANILVDDTEEAIGLYDASYTFLLGRYAQIATNFNYTADGELIPLATGKSRDYRYNEYELYVQDTWKIRNDLTVFGGLRWQFYQPPYETNGFQAHNDLDYGEIYSRRVANAAAGISGFGSEPLVTYDLIGPKNGLRNVYRSDWNNFGPRLGFAWNPSFKDGVLGKLFGDRKTVVRGGASQVFDRVGGGITFIQDQVTYLFDGSATTRFGSEDPNASLMNDPRFTSITGLPVQNTAPVITRPFTPNVIDGAYDLSQAGAQNYTISKDFEIPYSYQFSFGVQRELPANFFLDVSYVGRLGRKLFAQVDSSQVTNFKDPVSGQFLLDAFNNVQRELQAGVAPNMVTPQQWFERQVGLGGTRFLTSIGFLREFFRIGDVTDMIVVLYANNLLDPNVGVSSQFATNSVITNLASSNYHGALISLQKRFAHGLQFDFNYTWSHSIDNQSSVTNTVFGGLICDLRDLTVCKGNSDFDIRHLVNANFIYELPFGRGKMFGKDVPGWLDQVIGGWTVSGIYTYRSGLPFSTNTGSYPVGYLVDSPAVFSGSHGALQYGVHDEGSDIQFFGNVDSALAQFRNPIAGETGNRNTLRSGSFWNADLALSKNFRMPWEGHRLQFRMEAYNVFNHHVFGIPNANINDTANFGVVTTSASAAREIQFALRYDF